MPKISPLVWLAGAIAATDWPDPSPARTALDAMMSISSASASGRPDLERLDSSVTAVVDARKRRRAAELLEQRKREATCRAARARKNPVPRVSIPDFLPDPAREESEMEF